MQPGRRLGGRPRLHETRPPGQGTERVSRYCYATIGTSNCFDRPDSDRKNQQLGSSGY